MKEKQPERTNESPPPVIEPGRANKREDIVRLLETILGLAVEMMNADRGVIILKSIDRLDIMASKNFPTDKPPSLKDLSSSVVEKVIANGAPLLTHDAMADPRWGQAASVVLHQITSVICVPLWVNERVIGAIYLDSRMDRQRFTDDNLSFINIFSHMAAIAIDYAYEYNALYQEKKRLVEELVKKWAFDEIIGRSPKMLEVYNVMRRVMNSDISVLLEGESGTGKEVVARALHYSGPRRDKAFVAQFCGNLSENLLESELFGHKKGAFTGAISDKKGLFEIADGGTFFLDEIADISPAIQSKLLRVVQEGEIRRVGDTEARKVDVRIISATNRDLKEEVHRGKFREDLFYRLNVISINLPPLRERPGDIPLLVHHFLRRYSEKYKVPLKRVAPKAMQTLSNYHWPGNVRELENTIERALILSQKDEIEVDDLFIPEAEKLSDKPKNLKDYERDIVLSVLDDCGGNKTRTAEILGVSLRWLHYKLSEWNKGRK